MCDLRIKLLSRSRTYPSLRYFDVPSPEKEVICWTELSIAESIGYIVSGRWMDGWVWGIDRLLQTGEKRSTWNKTCSAAPQIPHALAWDRTCATAVRSQPSTVKAMAWTQNKAHLFCSNIINYKQTVGKWKISYVDLRLLLILSAKLSDCTPRGINGKRMNGRRGIILNLHYRTI